MTLISHWVIEKSTQCWECDGMFNQKDFIAGPNHHPGQVVTWFGHTILFETNVEIINEANISDQSNVDVLLEDEIKNCKSFNGNNRDRKGFMDLG